MTCHVEVRFTPAEFRTLGERDLSRTTCVVFDVLRATSTIITALAAGARGILPVSEIAEALVIAEGTAVRHVANILNKLALHSRAQVAVWGVRHLHPVP